MLLHKTVCRNLLRFTEIQQKNNFLHPFKSKYLDITYRSHRNTSFKDSIRQPRIERTPFEGFQVISNGHVPVSHIWKALMFTGAFTTGCFVMSSIWEYENARSLVIERSRMVKTPWFTNKHKEIATNPWENFKKDLLVQWNKLSPGEKVFVPICAVNLLVFGLWRVPSLKSKMLTYFCSNPSARVVCWPMFLSTFSHYSMFHIFANMYVLHSFSNAAVMSMGKEQFLAVYFSGGVLASLGSILYKAITKQAGFSLGASGAIMTILAYVCAQYPDTQLSIMFLPMFTFSAGAAIKVIMGLDIAGCILGWKLFDHAAHLGGALFGIFWAYKGREIWQKRLKIISLYHDWRKQK